MHNSLGVAGNRDVVVLVIDGLGAELHYVIPAYQRDSGLTRAAFRAAGTLHPAATLDEVRAGILSVGVCIPARSRGSPTPTFPSSTRPATCSGPSNWFRSSPVDEKM